MSSLINCALTIGVVLFILGCFLGPMFRGAVRAFGGILIGVALVLGYLLAQALLWAVILVMILIIVLAIMVLRAIFRRRRW